jgi:hypothetical protein
VLLAIVIFSAATRAGWLPGPVAAVAAAGLLTLVGVLAPAQARASAARLAPVLGFLAALSGRPAGEGQPAVTAPGPGPGQPGIPLFTLVTVAATLAGFVVASFAG